VEDIIAAYAEPEIETPINEALALEEKEALKIKKTFLKKSAAYIFVGLVITLVIGYTILYNLQYKVFATGVVTGSFVKVTANESGILDKIHVKNHETVDNGLVLFDLMITENVRRPRIPPASFRALEASVQARFAFYVSSVIDDLKERADSKQREYIDAKILFSQRLITRKDFNNIYNNYLKSKIDYERERDRVREENERRIKRLAALEDDISSLKAVTFETVTVPTLKRRISPIEGVVYRIEHSEGEFVHPDQIVMILQTREKPFVVVKLHSREIYKVKINDTARIYSKYKDKSYRGKVTQIGYAAVNVDASISQEASLNESLIKIEFIDDQIEFPLNSRVEVRIKRDLFQG
ncbi:MAG: HlyD family efflux transporter periplasmic adaptor subunit, partial [Desulfobacterales bacterium]|nr:HlyD family efflux transporter periplasmic adaptor subunit [Desulfobacterales bacterium]